MKTMGKLFDIMMEAYLFTGQIEPDQDEDIMIPDIADMHICAICDFEFIEGRRVTFETYVENVCEDCYSDKDYLEILTRKNIKKIEILN